MKLPDWLVNEIEDRKVKRRKHIEAILLAEKNDLK